MTGSPLVAKPPPPSPREPAPPARAASTELPADRDRDGAERQGRKLADATRAELTRIATEFERAAAEHIARVEQIVDQATAQGKVIEERVAGLDQRQAEFTRRVQEGLEHLDAQVAVWRQELGRLHGEAERAIERRIAELDAHGQVTAGKAEADVAAATQAEASVRAAAENQTHELEAAGVATRHEVPDALARPEAGLAEAAEARATDLDATIAEARSALEQFADSRVEGLEAVYREFRAGIADFQRHVVAAMQRSGDDQVAALDRAANAWIDRIDRAGRKRHRGVWRRRAAPPATAMMLAIATAFGVLWFRGTGDDRSGVAGASLPTSPPAVAAQSPPPVTEPPTTSDSDTPELEPIHWTAPPGQSQPQTTGSLQNSAAAPAAATSAGATTTPGATATPGTTTTPGTTATPDSPTAPSQPPPTTAPPPSSPLDVLDPVVEPVCNLTGVC